MSKANYFAEIPVGSIIIEQDQTNLISDYYYPMLGNAVRKLYVHMGETMDIHYNPPRSEGEVVHHKDFAQTPDDILVIYDLTREGSPRFESARDTTMDITLKSHKTPVEPLKQELTKIIIDACAEMKR